MPVAVEDLQADERGKYQLGESDLAWFALNCQVASLPADEPLSDVIAEAPADSPEVVAKLQETFDAADADELREIRQFVEACSQRAGQLG